LGDVFLNFKPTHSNIVRKTSPQKHPRWWVFSLSDFIFNPNHAQETQRWGQKQQTPPQSFLLAAHTTTTYNNNNNTGTHIWSEQQQQQFHPSPQWHNPVELSLPPGCGQSLVLAVVEDGDRSCCRSCVSRSRSSSNIAGP
jgi:hypothetical protein